MRRRRCNIQHTFRTSAFDGVFYRNVKRTRNCGEAAVEVWGEQYLCGEHAAKFAAKFPDQRPSYVYPQTEVR